jgi:hypothetical protein
VIGRPKAAQRIAVRLTAFNTASSRSTAAKLRSSSRRAVLASCVRLSDAARCRALRTDSVKSFKHGSIDANNSYDAAVRLSNATAASASASRISTSRTNA